MISKYAFLMLLLRLNKYILISILLDWVELSQFGALLSSISGKNRSWLLDVLGAFSSQFSRPLFSPQLYVPLRTSTLQWFESVRIDPPTSIVIDWSIMESIQMGVVNFIRNMVRSSHEFRSQSQLLKQWLASAKRVKIISVSNGTALRYCDKVERLEVCGVGGNVASIILPACGPSVRVLDLAGIKFFNAQELFKVCFRCPNLIALKLPRLQMDLTSLLNFVVVNCRSLLILDLNKNGNQLHADPRALIKSLQRGILMSRVQYWNIELDTQSMKTLIQYRHTAMQSASFLRPSFDMNGIGHLSDLDLGICGALVHC